MTARAALVGPTNIGRVVVGFMFGGRVQRHRLVGPAMLRRPGQRRMILTVRNRTDRKAALSGTGAIRRQFGPPTIGAIIALCWMSAASAQQPIGRDRATMSLIINPPAAMSAQDPPDAKPEVHVVGKVIDRDEKVVNRAEVSFSGPKKGKVWTDTKGAFSFSGPAGGYVVTVTAGERRQTFSVTIEGDLLKPSTLKMNPEALDDALIRE